MKRIEKINNIIAMAIIHTKANNLNEFKTDFEECEYFQNVLYKKFKEMGITTYNNKDFNGDFLEISQNEITIKDNRSYIETLMQWLSKIPSEISEIILDEQIMLEILVDYKQEKIDSETKKVEIIKNKLAKSKVLKK